MKNEANALGMPVNGIYSWSHDGKMGDGGIIPDIIAAPLTTSGAAIVVATVDE
ncbi:MAG: hypothetical protein NT004_08525 [Bacteroidetes bacterium]|nr:hypothetical protein [Bacteroidota bacterium]